MSTANERDVVERTVEELMSLTPEERLAVGERLIASVPPAGVERTDDEWKAELERRVREYACDPTSVVPASDVDEHARQRIAERC